MKDAPTYYDRLSLLERTLNSPRARLQDAAALSLHQWMTPVLSTPYSKRLSVKTTPTFAMTWRSFSVNCSEPEVAMAGYLLRKIEKNRWMPEAYVAQDDVPADALRDLQTGSNKLSVWLIEEDKSDLERIVVALAAMRNVLSNLDYALLDSGILDKINIKMSDSLGNSPDLTANSRWHRDLIRALGLANRGSRKSHRGGRRI